MLGFSFGKLVALTALQLERRLFASLTVVEARTVTLCGRDPDALDVRARLAALYDRAVEGDGPAAARDLFAYMDRRALGRIQVPVAADDPRHPRRAGELRVWRTPLSPAGLAGVTVPVLVVTGARSPAAMHRIGEDVARVTGGRHHVQHAAGHAAHLTGVRSGRYCVHTSPTPRRRSWQDPVDLVRHTPRGRSATSASALPSRTCSATLQWRLRTSAARRSRGWPRSRWST
ncbi:MAG TPA: hypothetical protein VK923_11010 [Euzebyales bacterium]|nr:hypothetical protein [Euzebyales bacterium]